MSIVLLFETGQRKCDAFCKVEVPQNSICIIKTSLLRRLQAQTLPDKAPPVSKIYQFSKIAVTFEPIQQF